MGQLDRPKPMVGSGRLETHLGYGAHLYCSHGGRGMWRVPLRDQEYGLRRIRSIGDTIDGKNCLMQAAYKSGIVVQIKPKSHSCRTSGTACPVGRMPEPGTGSLVGLIWGGGVDRAQHVSALLSAHCLLYRASRL